MYFFCGWRTEHNESFHWRKERRIKNSSWTHYRKFSWWTRRWAL